MGEIRQNRQAARVAVIYRPITELGLDPKNPRRHSPKQISQIARSIETFGFNVPVLVDATSKVIAGHGRIMAAQSLGLREVPTIRLEHRQAQARAFMIADKRSTSVTLTSGSRGSIPKPVKRARHVDTVIRRWRAFTNKEALHVSSGRSFTQIEAEKGHAMADDKGKEYEVGFGKPPKDKRFKKGLSGNPKGRPKGENMSLSQLLERELNQTVEVTEGGRRRKRIPKYEAMIKTLVNKAIMQGDIRCLKLILEERSKTEPPPGPMQYPIEFARQILADARRKTEIPHPPEWEGLSKTPTQEEARPPFDARAMPDEGKILGSS